MNSKFKGHCVVCQLSIFVGQPITKDKDLGWIHTNCAEEAADKEVRAKAMAHKKAIFDAKVRRMTNPPKRPTIWWGDGDPNDYGDW